MLSFSCHWDVTTCPETEVMIIIILFFYLRRDGILYTIVVVCLLLMAYGKDLKDHHPVNAAVRNAFVKTAHPFDNLTTVDGLWYWLENDLLDTLYWDKWYNGQKVQEEQVGWLALINCNS